MAHALEPIESRFAPWVVGMVVTSVVLALLTILLSLTDGMVGKAFPFGVASLLFAVTARFTAQGVSAHRVAATVALVVGIIAFGSGLQSLLLGTGQI